MQGQAALVAGLFFHALCRRHEAGAGCESARGLAGAAAAPFTRIV